MIKELGMLSEKSHIRWIPIMVILLACRTCKSSDEVISKVEDDKVLEDFIKVPGMRMTEYNFWRQNTSLLECARICLEETPFYCKSFSISTSALGCGIYENSRCDAAPGIYGSQIIPLSVSGDSPNWIYYERKSEGYRLLEEKIKYLDNLTEIDLDFATNVLTQLTTILSVNEETQSSGDVTISSAELNLMNEMMQRIISLNPVLNATPEVSEGFAQLLMNTSDAMMRPEHVDGWLALQQDPLNSGVAKMVMSTEAAGRDISERLLHFDNSTSIVVESESVGMWFDIVLYPEVKPSPPLLGFTHIAADLMEKIARILNKHQENSLYTFPKEKKQRRRPRRRRIKSNPTRDSVVGDDIIKLPTEALRNRSVVVHVRYKRLQDIIPSQYVNSPVPPKGTTYSIVSSVLTTSVHPKPPETIFEENPVTIVFTQEKQEEFEPFVTSTQSLLEISTEKTGNGSFLEPDIEITKLCVFWKDGQNGSLGGWSEDGCVLVSSNESHTVCECKHLTSFAVLLQMVDTSSDAPSVEIHRRALSYVSYIGCTLSLVGVSIMCAAFILLKFHTENMKIHFNLGVAVGAADCIFIFEEFAQKERYSCVLVTVLLYYTNMAVLSWMLIEGLFLYSQVIVVFVSARRWVRYYVLAGWGIPAIVMGIAMGILNVQLGKNRVCWLSPADNSIWAFAVPAILVIVVNFIILISVVRVIYGIHPVQGNCMRVDRVKNAVKGSIFLSPLLGTTWLFGLLSLSEETVFFQYLFATVNSLQGFFLFLFHCVCNSEVRANIARRRNRKPTTRGAVGGKSTWGTFGLNVASGLRKFRNSISLDFANISHSTSENTAEKNSKSTSKVSSPESEQLPSVEPCHSNSPNLAKDPEDELKLELTLEPRTLSKILEEHPEKHTPSKTKLPPLPLMPMKNDVIMGGRSNKVYPEIKGMSRKGNRKKVKSGSSPENAIPNPDATENTPSDEIDFPDNKHDYGVEEPNEDIGMSYDSGLNSIDNESLFDGDDTYDEMVYGDYIFSIDGIHTTASVWKDEKSEDT